ncbi:hypothetical protein MKX03_000096 [Papaver bracteatum]|nr:hypothetical protein MKX03_000096 [Papaver bracteatum]
MRGGLSVAGGGDLKMLLSYVNSFPTGPKRGLFYAFDIGGTNFRVLRILLDGEGNLDRDGTEMKSWEIHEDQKTGTKEGLFGFIASALRELVDREVEIHKIPRETERKIGFTFSFPVNETAINEGTLIEWTKGFNVSDTVGENVVACLEEALVRLNLNMFSVTALVNDAVGTLSGAIYTDSDVKVAVILGTGTNACYIERMDTIPKIEEEDGHTIINTEWGAFSQGVLPLTEFDQHLGDNDDGRQIFEKMISGKYLGSIVSQILLEMARSENLFGEDYTGTVVLSTADINKMHSDDSDELETVGSTLNERLDVQTTLEVRRTVVNVIDTIVNRAARLAGAGIVAILQKMELDTPGLIHEKRTVVAISGSLYQKYEQYQLYLKEIVTELLGSYVVIIQFPDASGIGAALLADTTALEEK